MNARCLGSLRHHYVKTPNLDRLAREGFLFDQAVCNNPICMPSRASMLAGQYPSTMGQYGFGGLCDRRTTWLQGALKQAGYRTGAFGKFHVDCISEDQWDFELAAADLPEDDDLARPRGWTYENYCRELGIPWMTDQIHGHIPFEHKRPDARGKDERCPSSSDKDMHPYMRWTCRSDVPLEHSIEVWETDQCLEGLRQFHETPDRPWFAWLTYQRPHCPTPLPEPWFRRIRPDDVELEPLPTDEDLATWPQSVQAAYRHGPSRVNLGDEDFRFLVASYYTLIEFIDDQIGRVLQYLEDTGTASTTTIIFTADHGDDAGQRGCYDKHGIFAHTEGVTNVPLIIRPAPCLNPAPPARITDPVELVDIAPTVLALSGLPIPERMQHEGRDLSARLLRGKHLAPHRPVFCEESARRMIKHRGWRLLFDAERDDECTLHDMNSDPLQHRSLYAREDPVVVARRIDLKRRLLAHAMQRHHGPFVEADITRIRRGLDPHDPTLPVRFAENHPNYRPFRAAVAITDSAHHLLVPYYDQPLLLFPREEGIYQTVETVLPVEPKVAEPMLDWMLRQAILRQLPVSVNHPRNP